MSRVMVAEVDLGELILRMVESLREDSRPKGMTTEEILRQLDPKVLRILERQARAAAEYVAECFHGAQLHRMH